MNSTAIKWLWALILWLVLGALLCWYFLCRPHASSNAAIGAATDKVSSLSRWAVADGQAYKSESNNYYHFIKSGSKVLNGDDLSIGTLNTSVKDYLAGNTSKGLNVIGYYTGEETNDNSLFENLGLARANSIKSQLVKLGIPAKNISTSAQLITDATFNTDTLMNGGTYGFFTIEDNSARLTAIKQAFAAKPLILYFQTNSNSLSLNAEQQKQFADLIYYLDNVADAKATIGGHTDNVGGAANNLKLSQERAQFAANYLATNGNINADRMDAKGFGQTKPIAGNDTAAGKAQNRRVEISL